MSYEGYQNHHYNQTKMKPLHDFDPLRYGAIPSDLALLVLYRFDGILMDG